MIVSRTAKQHGNRRNRRGTAAVEFAVCSFFVMVLVVGLQEIGHAIAVKEGLTDAARAAARVGALPGTSTATAQAKGLAVLQDLFGSSSAAASTNNVYVYLIPGPGAGSAWTAAPSTSNATTSDISTAKRGDAIYVKIQVPLNEVLWVTGWFFNNANNRAESERVIMLRQG